MTYTDSTGSFDDLLDRFEDDIERALEEHKRAKIENVTTDADRRYRATQGLDYNA